MLAPQHIRYEVANAVRTAVRGDRLDPAEGWPAVAEFLAWRIPTVDDDDLVLAAFDLEPRCARAVYDGLYLAPAEAAGCPLVYADERPRNALAGRFPLALWIDDDQPVGP